MKKHIYLAVENIGLNDTQRDTLIDALKKLGPKSHPQPACLCHWRTRLDKEAVILEALFEEDNLEVGYFKDKLGAMFNVDPDTIDSVTQHTQYGPLATFSRGGDRLKFLLFGGINATWQESGDACRAFLAANKTEWETEDL